MTRMRTQPFKAPNTRPTIRFPLTEDGKLSLDMDHMTLEEQEAIWRLSRDNRVVYQDINGEWWDILDMTGTEEDSSNVRDSLF